MQTQNQPTKETAVKVIELLSHGLVRGLGRPYPGEMCVEAAVCYAMGLPHSDKPKCVSSVVRSFKITLNDCNWSTDMTRANGLKRLAVAQLGSKSIDETLFVKELVLSLVRKVIPIVLRAGKNPDLESYAIKCELAENLKDAAAHAADAADAAAHAAAHAADADAADAAADAARAVAAAAHAADAADAAADAADAADAAAHAAAHAAVVARAVAHAADAADADAADAAADSVLSLMAECGVEALQKCNSPGCQWLELCN